MVHVGRGVKDEPGPSSGRLLPRVGAGHAGITVCERVGSNSDPADFTPFRGLGSALAAVALASPARRCLDRGSTADIGHHRLLAGFAGVLTTWRAFFARVATW